MFRRLPLQLLEPFLRVIVVFVAIGSDLFGALVCTAIYVCIYTPLISPLPFPSTLMGEREEGVEDEENRTLRKRTKTYSFLAIASQLRLPMIGAILRLRQLVVLVFV
jgi:hypothetical protein